MLGDIRDLDDAARGARGCDAVCHLAAVADVGEVARRSRRTPSELNARGTLNVLEAARRAGVARVVYASTIWVYSDVDADEVDEDTLLAPARAPLHRDASSPASCTAAPTPSSTGSSPRSCASASPTARARGPRPSIPSFVAQGAAPASR